MIRYKNRPATIIAAVPPSADRWYKIATENGKEFVRESELTFDNQADIDQFNKDYSRNVSKDNTLEKTEDKQTLKDIKETDKLKQKVAKGESK